ncbi:unnamed protein product [Vitrella brassicaformis CCMP3155]|uniref:Uncharacterized protein n=1 Tax=Vitrella brassicaformis (strain CCMP3155) TaxID=1169540 RepID=A0A0G4FM49_VITBC|nr:unnamed protein product [Vitrella brassicaformis CCMP3155]|eukprot:CEM14903.1 unnamed protein product [Vitrella brassicaformis CCMP3155]
MGRGWSCTTILVRTRPPNHLFLDAPGQQKEEMGECGEYINLATDYHAIRLAQVKGDTMEERVVLLGSMSAGEVCGVLATTEVALMGNGRPTETHIQAIRLLGDGLSADMETITEVAPRQAVMSNQDVVELLMRDQPHQEAVQQRTPYTYMYHDVLVVFRSEVARDTAANPLGRAEIPILLCCCDGWIIIIDGVTPARVCEESFLDFASRMKERGEFVVVPPTADATDDQQGKEESSGAEDRSAPLISEGIVTPAPAAAAAEGDTEYEGAVAATLLSSLLSLPASHPTARASGVEVVVGGEEGQEDTIAVEDLFGEPADTIAVEDLISEPAAANFATRGKTTTAPVQQPR